MPVRPVLHVVHADPWNALGGTERHVRDLVAAQGADCHVLWKEVHSDLSAPKLQVGGTLRAQRLALALPPRFRRGVRELWFAPRLRPLIQEAIERTAPRVLHLHNAIELGLDALEFARTRGARIVATLHDHSFACPRGQRIRADLSPCETLDRARCAPCMRPLSKAFVRGEDRRSALRLLLSPRGGQRWFATFDRDLRERLRLIDVFIAPSRSAAELFQEFLPDAPVVVLPHAVPSIPAPSSSQAPTNHHVSAHPDHHRPRIGFVGSALRTKGIETFLAAAELLRDEADAEIHGPIPAFPAGPSPSALRASPAKAHGPFSPGDLPLRLARLNALALPALWPETFSYAAHEALAFGLPVVASALGAFKDLATAHPTRLLLVPPGDPSALAHALRHALLLPRQPISHAHSEEPMNARMEQLYLG